MTHAVRAGRPYAVPEPPVFGVTEIGVAAAVAALIQVSFFLVLIAAGAAESRITPKEEPASLERPISVKPILDDAPLLKLGGKKRAKLPEMWKKQAAVKRYEEASAPSPLADKTPDALPTSPLVHPDAEAPPPDADLAKKVDDDIKLMDAAPPVEPEVAGEGSPDGVKEGTETDPLKARAVSLYRAKIIAWFNARFRVPAGQIPCEELKKLSSRVSANVSPDGTVTGFSVGNPSGNATFDGRVQSAMQSAVGQQVPPPPPLYPAILPPSISLNFQGSSQKCD